MSSNRESKSAAKGQKKIQKTNKKQKQLQEQQQQQQQSTANNNKNGIANSTAHAKTKQGDPKNNRNINNNYTNNNNNSNENNNYSNNNNNNDNMIQNNNGSTSANPISITQKFKEHYEEERRSPAQLTTPEKSAVDSLPKMERTSSFRGKLSRIFNHLTGSKENLARSDDLKDEAGKTPFTFTRSRSMIMLRRPNRRSFIEPQLEQLSEEAEKSGDPMSPASPRKNSLADSSGADNTPGSPLLRRRADTVNSTPARRQSAFPSTSTPLEQTPRTGASASRKVSLTPSDPQLHFQKRRSNTLIASFKSTFSGLTGSSSSSNAGAGGGSSTGSSDKKKDKMNPKWSASLQSLQAIDNMVSYANMSYIDYDKFNGYEKQLERQHSLMSLADQPTPVMQPLQLPATATAPGTLCSDSHWHSSTRLADSPTPSPSITSGSLPQPHTPTSLDSTSRTVVMRRKNSKSSSLIRPTSSSSRHSGHSYQNHNLDSDIERNLDRRQNVYRESLDSRTLDLLNQCSRNSYILDQAMLLDALNLEDGSANQRCEHCSQLVSRVNSFKQRQDVVDGSVMLKKPVSCLLYI